MKRQRLRKWAKWTCTVACCCVVALLIGNRRSSWHGRSGPVYVLFFGGALRLEYFKPEGSPFFDRWELERLTVSANERLDWYWWFAWEAGGRQYTVSVLKDGKFKPLVLTTRPMVRIPMWLPALLFAVPAGLLWRTDIRAARRSRSGSCPDCGYDRRGLATDAKCPECGAASIGG